MRILRFEQVQNQSAPELRLEPGGFRRHDLPGVRNRHHLFEAGGMQREGDRVLTRLDLLLELRGAPDTAHEIDPLVRPRISDSQDRTQEIVLEDGDVQDSQRAFVEGSWFGRELVPNPLEEHSELMRAFRFGSRSLFHLEPERDLLQQLLRAQAMEILDHAVVAQNLHLIMGKHHHQEEVAFSRRLPSLLRLLSYPGGGSRSMMPVGNIERWNLLEHSLEARSLGLRDGPEGVADPILADEVDLHFLLL